MASLVPRKPKADDEIISQLRSRLKVKGLGEETYFMRYHISRDRVPGKIQLDQHLCVKIVAERFNTTKTSAIPMATGMKALTQRKTNLIIHKRPN